MKYINTYAKKDINIVAQNTQSTVVAEYTPSKKRAEHYRNKLLTFKKYE